jgi:DNA polymerase-3 subunit delta
MKQYSNKAGAFIANPSCNTVLIYGNDAGGVRATAAQLIKVLMPQENEMGLTEFSPEQLLEDESLLATELTSMGFFAEQKIVKIDDAKDEILPQIKAVLPHLSRDNFLIICAGELTPASKIRKFYEDSKELTALLCYKDDEATLRSFIGQKLREARITPDRDAMDYLVNNLGEDKMITNNELDKIITYLGHGKELGFEDVAALLADSSELTLGDLAFAVSARDNAKLEKNLARVRGQQIAGVAVLRMVAWHFERLLTAKATTETGQGIDFALKTLRPPVFFRQVAPFKQDLSKWSLPQLKTAMQRIYAAELAVKKGGLDEDIICHHALIEIMAA